MRFAANLTMLFTELPLTERFAAAATAGFQGVECLFPYDHDADDLSGALRASGLPLVLINTPPGDWAKGERGFAAVPDRQVAFRAAMQQAMALAHRLQPRFVHIMSGNASGDAAFQTLVANLIWATAQWPDQDFLIEPLNPFDMPGYFLCGFEQALSVLDAVNAPNLALQFDAFHAHRITGDVLACWQGFGPRARHIQFADHPGRHEPGSGRIDLAGFFAQVAADGYQGFVSAEYVPSGPTHASLNWLRAVPAINRN